MSYVIEKTGTAHGLKWAVLAIDMGHRCGYIEVPAGHPIHGKGYGDSAPGSSWDELEGVEMGKRGILSVFCADRDKPPSLDVLFDVHGSITYAGEPYWDGSDPEAWALGFDASHDGDGKDPSIMSEQYRELHAKWGGSEAPAQDLQYMISECESLARQIAERYPQEKHA